MSAIAALLFSKIGAYLAAAIGIGVALFAAHQKGKATGVAQEKINTVAAQNVTANVIATQAQSAAKAQTEAATAQVTAIKEMQDVHQTVDGLSPSATTSELLSEFSRDPKPGPGTGGG